MVQDNPIRELAMTLVRLIDLEPEDSILEINSKGSDLLAQFNQMVRTTGLKSSLSDAQPESVSKLVGPYKIICAMKIDDEVDLPSCLKSIFTILHRDGMLMIETGKPVPFVAESLHGAHLSMVGAEEIPNGTRIYIMRTGKELNGPRLTGNEKFRLYFYMQNSLYQGRRQPAPPSKGA